MRTHPEKTPGDPTDPIDGLRGGGRAGLAGLLGVHRERLRRSVELRTDARLRDRIDRSDVLQVAFLDVSRDLDASPAHPKLPLFLWRRLHVGKGLTTLRRRHPGTTVRIAGLENSLHQGASPGAGCAALESMPPGRVTSPTQAPQRTERRLRVHRALKRLKDALWALPGSREAF